MIAYLKGTVIAHTKDGAVVLNGATGYEVTGTWLGREPVGSQIEAWIYQYIENESIPRMIGCATLESRNIFLQLLSVQGVGPKMAGRIVDSLSPSRLIAAISGGDIDTLRGVKGLGRKTAQKIVLELGKILVTDLDSSKSGIVEALSSLKFTPREIQLAIEGTKLDGLSEDDQLAAILRTLGGKS